MDTKGAAVDTKRLYRVEEAAALLSLGRSKTWEMVSVGELKTIRIGRSVRIPADELDRFVAERVAATSAV